MTLLTSLAAAALSGPPVPGKAQPAVAWSPEATVVALFVVGVALVFLAGVLVGDVVRTWKGRR